MLDLSLGEPAPPRRATRRALGAKASALPLAAAAGQAMFPLVGKAGRLATATSTAPQVARRTSTTSRQGRERREERVARLIHGA